MASQLIIANWALTLIGEKRLSSLSDDNQNAEMVSEFWDPVRDALIAQQAWHDFIERTSLAADTAEPAWGYSYQYSFASNVVRPLQIGPFYVGLNLSSYRNSDSAEYRIEQRKILTDLGAPLYVKCLINTPEIGTWQPCFAKLMAADLAESINPRATENETIGQRLAGWRTRAWYEAASVNAVEDPPEPLADDSFIAAHQA
jgi:hypothetical protein